MLKRLTGLALAAALQMAGTGYASAQATNSEALSDVRVREAIAYAIDMDTIAATLLEGKAIVADSLLPNGPLKPAGLNPFSYDPDKARALLKEAGWDSNRTLDMVFYYGDQLTVDLMAAVQSYLADVGIKMTYRLLQGDVGAQLTAKPDDPVNGPAEIKWDLAYGAAAAIAPQEYYNTYGTGLSSSIPGNKELDSLIAGINSSADVNVQKPAFFAIEEYWNQQLPTIPLYYQQLFIIQSDRLDRNGRGYGNEQYNWDWGIVDWTVKPDAAGNKVAYTNSAPKQFFELPWSNLGIWITTKIVFDRLLVSDGALTPIRGSMADSYSVADDGMSATFTLKDGLTWQDGAPITAKDVAWSIETAIKVPTIHGVVRNTFSSIKGADAFAKGTADSVSGIATDGNTITLTMAKLDPNLLMTFSQFAILPEHLLKDADPLQLQQDPFWQKPIGSGPYQIDEVQMNDFVRYVPFKNYHGGVAKIDEIVAFPSGDGDGNLIKNATAHKMDFGFTKNTADVATLEAMNFMKVIPADIPYTRMIWINQFPRK
jgi:peptide/nickel transport system substrate-binding protein